jgi:2-hydroxychromene-2-carboxylate isomerase
MIQTVEIFYSFESPYSYLANDNLAQLEDKYEVRVLWHPYSARAAGQNFQAPSMHSTQVSYVKEDVVRLAKKMEMPLVMRGDWPEHQFDPERSIRGALVASDLNILYEYNIKMFQRWWGEAEDPNDQSFLIELCDDLDIDPNEFSGRMNTSDIRERVRGNFKRGQKLGIFDVPMVLVGEERFFGFDRLCAVEERLSELNLQRGQSF